MLCFASVGTVAIDSTIIFDCPVAFATEINGFELVLDAIFRRKGPGIPKDDSTSMVWNIHLGYITFTNPFVN
jgi:hypothetical protein